MGNPSKDLIEAEGTLRVVIENLIDAQHGMEKLGEEARDEALKRHFLAESLKRAEFRGELEDILHHEGVRDLHETGTTAGAVARAWRGLKAKVGGDHGLLSAAQEAENEVLQAYADALKKELPLPIRQKLATQAAHLQESLDYIIAMRKDAA